MIPTCLAASIAFSTAGCLGTEPSSSATVFDAREDDYAWLAWVSGGELIAAVGRVEPSGSSIYELVRLKDGSAEPITLPPAPDGCTNGSSSFSKSYRMVGWATRSDATHRFHVARARAGYDRGRTASYHFAASIALDVRAGPVARDDRQLEPDSARRVHGSSTAKPSRLTSPCRATVGRVSTSRISHSIRRTGAPPMPALTIQLGHPTARTSRSSRHRHRSGWRGPIASASPGTYI
jgi:hypothetical protein